MLVTSLKYYYVHIFPFYRPNSYSTWYLTSNSEEKMQYISYIINTVSTENKRCESYRALAN